MTFYAYLHCKPDGTPFYVGKGSYKRSRVKKSGRNKYYERVAKKCGYDNVLIGRMECSSNDIACSLEVGLIKRLISMGVKLCNLTSGGESGYSFPDVVREKISGEKNPAKRPEVREKLSASMMGNKNFLGKIPTEEHRDKIRRAHLGKKLSDEHKHKLRLAKLGKKQTPETIKLRTSALVGNSHTLGMCWITDGVRCKMITKNDEVPSGWRRGRVFRGHP